MERKTYDMKAGWVNRAMQTQVEEGVGETEFEDTNVVAYLHYNGFRFMPIRKEEGRINFIVYGDVGETMDKLYDNGMVRVLDFIKCIKIVRSAMFNMKKMHHEGND